MGVILVAKVDEWTPYRSRNRTRARYRRLCITIRGYAVHTARVGHPLEAAERRLDAAPSHETKRIV